MSSNTKGHHITFKSNNEQNPYCIVHKILYIEKCIALFTLKQNLKALFQLVEFESAKETN